MGIDYFALVLAGALAGGFVNGLTGFGTGLTALGVWLFVLSPSVAATLVIVCSVAAHLQNLPKIWRSIEWGRIAPFLLPGLFGVPFGAALLSYVEVRSFKIAIGCLLLAYSLHALTYRSRAAVTWGGRWMDGLVGLAGGVLGGLAGLSGVLPTVWADFRGWTKEQRRTLFQAFNMTILFAALASHFFAGLLTPELGVAFAVALPGTFLGSWLGYTLYSRLSDKRYKEIILLLLCAAGVSLVVTNAF